MYRMAEQSEKCFAVGLAARVGAVGVFQRTALAANRAGGNHPAVAFRKGGGEFVGFCLQFDHLGGDAVGEAEDVLGAEEKPGAGVAAADEGETAGEGAGGGEGGIALEIAAAGGYGVHSGGDAFKEGGFSRAVFADEKRDGCGKFLFLEVEDQGQRPGILLRVGLVVGATAEGGQEITENSVRGAPGRPNRRRPRGLFRR
jgi:hypothetical protein